MSIIFEPRKLEDEEMQVFNQNISGKTRSVLISTTGPSSRTLSQQTLSSLQVPLGRKLNHLPFNTLSFGDRDRRLTTMLPSTLPPLATSSTMIPTTPTPPSSPSSGAPSPISIVGSHFPINNSHYPHYSSSFGGSVTPTSDDNPQSTSPSSSSASLGTCNSNSNSNNGTCNSNNSTCNSNNGTCNSNSNNGTCIMARVKAQVMSRDDSTGCWIPICGGGLSHIMIIRRRSSTHHHDHSPSSISSSSSSSSSNLSLNNAVITSSSKTSNNIPYSSPPTNCLVQKPLPSMRKFVSTIHDPSHVIGTNDSHSNNDERMNEHNNNHHHDYNNQMNNYEYIIIGTKISDQRVLLYCTIESDFVYNQVIPTFHHWISGSIKFGLTFVTTTEANKFVTAIREAIRDLSLMNGLDTDEENQDSNEVTSKTLSLMNGLDTDEGNQYNEVTSKTSTTIGGKLLRTTSVPPQVQIMET